MRKIIIALVMATIATSLFISAANASTTGYSLIGTANAAGSRILYRNITLTVPEGNVAHLTGIWIYSNSGGTVQGAIFDQQKALYYGSVETVSTAKWYLSAISADLTAGNYVMAVAYANPAKRYFTWYSGYTGAEYNLTDATSTIPYILSFSSFTSENEYSFYLEYDYGELTNLPSTVSLNWTTFAALLSFSFICILLILKSNIPILNFVFGTITLGTGAYYLGTEMIFAGWINLLAILMASLCMLSGAIKLRNT